MPAQRQKQKQKTKRDKYTKTTHKKQKYGMIHNKM